MKYLFIIILVFSFSSCQRDKLEGTSSALVGRWKWEYSREFKKGFGQTEVTKIYASDFSSDYFIDFNQRGYLEFIEDGNIQAKHNIYFSIVDSTSNPTFPIYFSIYLDKDENFQMAGSFSVDSLKCGRQPLPYTKNESSGSVSYSYEDYYSKLE